MKKYYYFISYHYYVGGKDYGIGDLSVWLPNKIRHTEQVNLIREEVIKLLKEDGALDPRVSIINFKLLRIEGSDNA